MLVQICAAPRDCRHVSSDPPAEPELVRGVERKLSCGETGPEGEAVEVVKLSSPGSGSSKMPALSGMAYFSFMMRYSVPSRTCVVSLSLPLLSGVPSRALISFPRESTRKNLDQPVRYSVERYKPFI